MNKENTKKLLTDFPDLYMEYTKPLTESLMCFGFDCGDGWFELIYELSKRISEYDPEVVAVQVKEKFGTLRFYIHGGDEKVDDMIDQAEWESSETCEACGKLGSLRGTSWVITLCENCWKKRLAEDQGECVEMEKKGTTWMAR